jgi:exonuclease SbcC
MNVSKIEIENLFGLSEFKLDGKSIELNGVKGVGKTSVIDAIIYALTNDTTRDKNYMIERCNKEGRILIKTDTGLSIERKKRSEQSDYKKIEENGRDIQSPEAFLKSIFTPMQLDPAEFTRMDAKEQNRILLDLIEFKWDMVWIQEQFGEIPVGINYEQNILRVLHDIQKNDGNYFLRREELNREARNKKDAIAEIAAIIPEGYQLEKWKNYDTGIKYRELEKITAENAKIEKCKLFKDSYDGKIRGLEAELQIEMSGAQREIQAERNTLENTIIRLTAELTAAKSDIGKLALKLSEREKLAKANHAVKLEKLKSDVGVAEEHLGKEIQDTTELNAEINEAEAMKQHINEYIRMQQTQLFVEDCIEKSEAITAKIEKARNLPGEILANAKIPVTGMTIVNGVPLINGLPVANLSTGEKIELCVDVATARPLALQLILLDRLGDLDDESRNILYAKCKKKGIQFIATRTTNSKILEVVTL